MKKIRIFSIALAVIAAAACAKQSQEPVKEDVNIVPEEENSTITFTAEYPDTMGEKTTIDDTGAVAWEAGDQITIYYLDNSVPSSTVATAQEAGKSVKFTASVPSGVTEYYAVYPAGTGEISSESIFTVKVGSSDGTFKNANIAAAYAPAGDNVNFKFKNASGLFKVQIPANGVIAHNDVNYTIESVTVTGKETSLALAGDVVVSVDAQGELSFASPASPVDNASVTLSSAARNQGYVWISALPFTSADGIAIRFASAEGKPVPAVLTKDDKSITLERGHIKPVNAACDNIVWDWYFTPEGTGNGKSADAPANLSTFQGLLNNSAKDYVARKLDGATLHLGEGTFDLTQQIYMPAGTASGATIVIDGAGNDKTFIDGTTLASSSTQMLLLSSEADMMISNLTIQNGKTSNNGGALSSLNATGKLSLNNVKFYNNYSAGGNSGALYIGGTQGTDITNCQFESNKAKTQGGAIAMGGSSAGEILIKDCTFLKNEAGVSNTSGSGGAIYDANTYLTKIDNCTFDANQAVKQGGAIKLDKAGCKMFLTRCLFVGNIQTEDNYGDGAAIYNAANKGSVGVFNCTFNYNHEKTKSSGVFYSASYIVANCTFVESMKSSYGCISNIATADHVSTIVNNIVITTSTTTTHCAISMKGDTANNHVDSGYNLVTRIQDGFTAASEESTNYTPVVKSNFGFADSVDKNTKSYAWGGDFSIFTGFTKCTLTDVEAKVKANTAIGNEFWAWLVSINAADVDVRGVKRNTNAMWPGSYQQDAAE